MPGLPVKDPPLASNDKLIQHILHDSKTVVDLEINQLSKKMRGDAYVIRISFFKNVSVVLLLIHAANMSLE